MPSDSTSEDDEIGTFAIFCFTLMFLIIGFVSVGPGDSIVVSVTSDTIVIDQESQKEREVEPGRSSKAEELYLYGSSNVEIGYDLDGPNRFMTANELVIEIQEVSTYPYKAQINGYLGTCDQLEDSAIEMLEMLTGQIAWSTDKLEQIEERHRKIFEVNISVEEGDFYHSERLEHEDTEFMYGFFFNDYCVIFENHEGSAESVEISTYMTEDSMPSIICGLTGWVSLCMSLFSAIGLGFVIYGKRMVKVELAKSVVKVTKEVEKRKSSDVLVSETYECRTCKMRFKEKQYLFDHLELNINHKIPNPVSKTGQSQTSYWACYKCKSNNLKEWKSCRICGKPKPLLDNNNAVIGFYPPSPPPESTPSLSVDQFLKKHVSSNYDEPVGAIGHTEIDSREESEAPLSFGQFSDNREPPSLREVDRILGIKDNFREPGMNLQTHLESLDRIQKKTSPGVNIPEMLDLLDSPTNTDDEIIE